MNLSDESPCNVNTLPSSLSLLSISFFFIDFWKRCRVYKAPINSCDYSWFPRATWRSLCVGQSKSIKPLFSISPSFTTLTSDPILGVLFLRRTRRNWNMAADRPTYPSSHPWTNWGLQLERDLATRINHTSEREEKALESLWEKCLSVCLETVAKSAPPSKRTAQNNLADFLSCLKALMTRLWEWEKDLIPGLKFILSGCLPS